MVRTVFAKHVNEPQDLHTQVRRLGPSSPPGTWKSSEGVGSTGSDHSRTL
jgi:hypothetical protein